LPIQASSLRTGRWPEASNKRRSGTLAELRL